MIANAEVARQLELVGDLLELDGANPFRVRAYRRAARTVGELAEPIAESVRDSPERLAELPGIGEDLAGKITEIVTTGSLGLIAELTAKVPKGLVEVTRLRGIGPKRAQQLHDTLGVGSLADLKRALTKGTIENVRGFGPKTTATLRRELGGREAAEPRVLRAAAAQYGEAYLEHLRAAPGIKVAEIAGSYRRCRETVGDLDLLVSCHRPGPVIERFVAYSEVERILEQGPQRASVTLRSGLQVDLRVLPAESYGAGLYYFTGSKAHNIAIRRLGQERGLKINEYGIFRGERKLGGARETDVPEALGFGWIPPELREDRGEIEAAQSGRLPRLVELRDIRGDLQVHTTGSDGRDTLEAMVEAAATFGHEYVAITDHSPAVRIVGGLDRKGFRLQWKKIDRLNAGRSRIRVLKGAEVDILADGSLDLDDDTLAELELVTVAIHSKLTLSRREQTRRVVTALKHPSVDVLAHPSGRLIGERGPMELDLDLIFRAAADHGVLLEINAQPTRLDLDDLAARAATEHGIKLVISTDAHAVAELGFMRWGVDQARRAWLTRDQVANTRSASAFLRFLHSQRR